MCLDNLANRPRVSPFLENAQPSLIPWGKPPRQSGPPRLVKGQAHDEKHEMTIWRGLDEQWSCNSRIKADILDGQSEAVVEQ